jgi:hypothetical protein
MRKGRGFEVGCIRGLGGWGGKRDGNKDGNGDSSGGVFMGGG